tara:strand:+ start:6654 stop:6884 length:231 start_codon:yes stop_codon:yes gene_type:complete
VETFAEAFYGKDSQYARTGGGPTVAGADVMKPPAQTIKTKALGDSRFTGFNDIPVKFPERKKLRIKAKRRRVKNGK